MQENHLFEYAIIRVVPRVEREEFLNVGIILYCVDKKFLQSVFTLDEDRLRAFSSQIDITELTAHLCAFQQVCKGETGSGPIGKLDAGARFRWLTAARSTIVQTSKVHPGLCIDPADTLARLHEKLVLNC